MVDVSCCSSSKGNIFIKYNIRRSVACFRAVFKSPTGQEESVTKPVLKTSHYLFCHGLDFGRFPVE